ncbi:MAG: hypothetical protein L3K09_08285, partial [Thermoplasmata archaeon]|nr:hypothetical protein [Thermoplasmata archaeon]
HAQQIANAIASANPHTQVTFALVDYFASFDNFDDHDGAQYHVDIASFVPASAFGTLVSSTFQSQVLGGGFTYPDSDFSDNRLHSSSTTALYGAITGSGLDWADQSHHVILWMGATAPRDPAYVQDYGALGYCTSSGECYSPSCEPSYVFAEGTSPACEGWVRSQDGNSSHSIAALATTSPSCTRSLGGSCTIDTIDLWATPTDPYSLGWPSGIAGGGPGGTLVQQNVERVLLAGCDLAAATGGSWAGPGFFTCPDGAQGSLQYVAHGPVASPNTENPTLLDAWRQVGFGPVRLSQVAAGTDRPMFTFVPFGHIALAPGSELEPSASCQRAGASYSGCDTAPSILESNGVTYLGWNWSREAGSNVMYVGDAWAASFNVIATGPPYGLVPVDACTTADCRAAGSLPPPGGLYSRASFLPATNDSVVTLSFPLAEIRVDLAPNGLPPNVPSPSVPPPPPPASNPVAVPLQAVIGPNAAVANLSVPAAVAWFLGAGFMRVGITNRAVALRVAVKASALRRPGEGPPTGGPPILGR